MIAADDTRVKVVRDGVEGKGGSGLGLRGNGEGHGAHGRGMPMVIKCCAPYATPKADGPRLVSNLTNTWRAQALPQDLTDCRIPNDQPVDSALTVHACQADTALHPEPELKIYLIALCSS